MQEIFFDEVVGKIATSLEGWKAQFLSSWGKATLIKSVFISLPIHLFTCMVVPKKVQRRIEGLIVLFCRVNKAKVELTGFRGEKIGNL